MRASRVRQVVAMVGAVLVALSPVSGWAASDEPVTLRIGLGIDAGGAQDPHTFTGNFTVLDMIYDPLVNYGEGGAIEPGLASSWEVSGDGLTVTFDLREGVTFHDGTAFDAEAVKWNFDRWVGGEDYTFFRTSQVISEVNVVGPLTIDLVLSEPYPPVLQELSILRPVRFLSPASVGPDGAFAEAVGTGPWLLESNSETGAALVRYDGYWGERSSIERVEFKAIPDSQTRLSALRAGEVDLLGGTYLAPITPVEAKELQSAEDIQLLIGEPDTTVVLGFNPDASTASRPSSPAPAGGPDGPLADPAVRVAVARALDRQALTPALFGDFGRPADTLFPPSIPDSGEPVDVSFDPDASRAALDDAGWVASGGGRAKDGEPLELDLLVPSTPVNGIQDTTTAAAAVAAALETVGIGVRINAVDEAAYYDVRSARNWDLDFVETLGAPYDPSSTAVSYLTTTGGDSPLWATPELDGLVDAAIFADDAERAAAYQKVFDYLEEQVAFIPLTRPSRLWAAGPAVSGFEVPVTDYDLDLSAVEVTR
ncbi:MAG: ABC transporter substrate-binding protein [Egibacteraceae bacterium]